MTLIKNAPVAAAPAPVSVMQAWTPEQLGLIKSTIAKGATNDELALFLHRCRVYGLDPLKPSQIHFIKYGNNPGSVVVGIDGLRAKANRTGKLRGIKRGVTKDEKGKLIGGWAEVTREGWAHATREEVLFEEYTTGRNNWLEMPETMIKKVAEAAALRMTFPDELGGLYTDDELEKVKDRLPYLGPDQPAQGATAEESDGVIDGSHGYRIPFGKYAQRSLEEVGPEALRGYVDYIEGKAAKDGKPVTGQVKDFVDRASAYVAAFENGSTE